MCLQFFMKILKNQLPRLSAALDRTTKSMLGKPGERSREREFCGPNEAVRIDLCAIFVAIPKTGTSSIRHQFSHPGPFFLPGSHLTIRQIEKLWHVWSVRETLHRNREFPTNQKVVMSDFEVFQESTESFSKAVKFATVRNPFARALSLYMRNEGIQVARNMTFDDFCEQLAFASDTCVWPSRNQCQIDWLIGWDNSTWVVDNILRLENLAKDLEGLARNFPQLSFLTDIKKNVNPNSGSLDYRAAYSSSARKAVEFIFRRDLEALSYDF